MALWNDVVEAYIASRDWDQATLSRLAFWQEALGERDILAITPDDIDHALMLLAERGRLKGGKLNTAATGKPLEGSTLNRYLSQAGSLFKYARSKRLVPRAFVSPTRGIERSPERSDPNRYLREEEVAKLIAVARVFDKRWGKMAALIVVAYHTGLRAGSILEARGKDFDPTHRTLAIAHTKNGDAIVAPLSSTALRELKKLPKVGREERIFGSRAGKPFNYRGLWNRIAREAGLPGRVFHELRHGHGHRLARGGASQQMIMQSMGHRTLTASARYAHANVSDKAEVIARVFG